MYFTVDRLGLREEQLGIEHLGHRSPPFLLGDGVSVSTGVRRVACWRGSPRAVACRDRCARHGHRARPSTATWSVSRRRPIASRSSRRVPVNRRRAGGPCTCVGATVRTRATSSSTNTSCGRRRAWRRRCSMPGSTTSRSGWTISTMCWDERARPDSTSCWVAAPPWVPSGSASRPAGVRLERDVARSRGELRAARSARLIQLRGPYGRSPASRLFCMTRLVA